MVCVSIFLTGRKVLASVLAAATLMGAVPAGATTAPATMSEPAASEFDLSMQQLFAGVEALLAEVTARFDAIRPTVAAPTVAVGTPWKPVYEGAKQAINQRLAAASTSAQQHHLETLNAEVAAAAEAQAKNDRQYAATVAAAEADYQQRLAQTSNRPVSVFRRVPGGLAGQLAATQKKATEAHVAAGTAINDQLQQTVAQVEEQYGDQVAAPPQSVIVAQLSWTIPTVRVSGAPLTVAELAGYELYYTSTASNASGVIVISAADQTAYPLAGLEPGSYFFAISAIDREGLKSDLSSMVEVQVP